jgi:hypothetical protein
MNYPASYDTAATTFGTLRDLVVLHLSTEVSETDDVFTFDESLHVDNLSANTFLSLPGETVRITSKGVNGSGAVNVERAISGSAKTHEAGTVATQEITSGTVEILKGLIIAAQKYRGLVGSALPASCVPGEAFIHSDGNLYVCFTDNTWTKITRPNHAEYTGLEAEDAHTIYYKPSDFPAWHASIPGEHLTNSASHNHSSELLNGLPVRKFSCGNFADIPAAKNIGDVFFALDQNSLYFSYDGSSWSRYESSPKGTTLLFDTECPEGWVRVEELDGRFPRGATAGRWANLVSGGSLEHSHVMPTPISHTHTVAAVAMYSQPSGAHTHSLSLTAGSGAQTAPYQITNYNITNLTSSEAGSHSHSVTIPATNTHSAGKATANTKSVEHLPSYKKLLFCRKT